DTAAAQRHLATLVEAHRRATAAGIGSFALDREVLGHRLAVAAASGDLPALGQALAEVAERDDRRLTELSAAALGRYAGRAGPQARAAALAAWQRQVDRQPYYLEVAWAALAAEDAGTAGAAADWALARFPGDAAVAAEHALIRRMAAAIPAR
ncbi:MAG: hypothetical protein L6R48_02665, partial [Planctomycetes bacterium]|nr:hypothetical protein [Planctomycetota bacterium]